MKAVSVTKSVQFGKAKKRQYPRRLPFYLLLLPAIVIVALFRYLPMTGLLVAFKDYSVYEGIFASPWADMYGFANFVELFETPAFVDAIWNTLLFNVVTILFSFPAPIVLAFLITEVQHKMFKKVTQTISYLPHFLSVAAVTGIVNSLLSEYGLINSVLFKLFGIEEGQDLLSKSGAFLPVYVITDIWKTVGWNTIIYLAAICGISEELYEAAEIDGAGRFRQVMTITLPGILPTVGILLILRMGTLFGQTSRWCTACRTPPAGRRRSSPPSFLRTESRTVNTRSAPHCRSYRVSWRWCSRSAPTSFPKKSATFRCGEVREWKTKPLWYNSIRSRDCAVRTVRGAPFSSATASSWFCCPSCSSRRT